MQFMKLSNCRTWEAGIEKKSVSLVQILTENHFYFVSKFSDLFCPAIVTRVNDLCLFLLFLITLDEVIIFSVF